MLSKYKIFHLKILYIFFVFLSLFIFFFSTARVNAKAFDVNNIEISEPFEINFDKNKVIDDGFRKAFLKLISIIVNSNDQKKITQPRINEIKGMIDSFSIKEEKFVNEVYYVNLGVTFNKKKIFNYLENKNIFPSIPVTKKILFLPIIIDENKKDLLLFSNNKIFDMWNTETENFHLIKYILPTEDLEDLNLLRSKYDLIEQYDFKDITSKYYLEDSIIALIFKNENSIRILSRIFIKNDLILKNQSFTNKDIDNIDQIKDIINELKIVYEDYWKGLNQINTSIKLNLSIKVNTSDSLKISKFEKVLKETDLIYDFYINKFDQDFINYQIIFNGTPDNFLKSMKNNDYYFNTQAKDWILK